MELYKNVFNVFHYTTEIKVIILRANINLLSINSKVIFNALCDTLLNLVLPKAVKFCLDYYIYAF